MKEFNLSCPIADCVRKRLPTPQRVWRLVFLCLLPGFLLSACGGAAALPAAATVSNATQWHTATQAKFTDAFTTIRVSQVSKENCKSGNVPVTFGLPLRRNDIPPGHTIQAYLRGNPVATQTDIRARNQSGSARHAVVTAFVPCEQVKNDVVWLALASRAQGTDNKRKPISLKDVIQSGFDASVALDLGGDTWTLQAGQLLHIIDRNGGCESSGKICRRWLSGPLVSTWIVGGPLVNSSGQTHPHLAAYFAIRAYGSGPVRRVRVDVIVENTWAYVLSPQNCTYDATIAVAGKGVYAVNDLEHYRQARWHKRFWWGKPGVLYAAPNPEYLQSTPALSSYLDVRPTDEFLSKVRQDCPPMENCDQTKTMGNTGAQAGIGPIPRWAAVYVLDTDYRAYRWMLANSDALGSYGVHYRVKTSGKPILIKERPCTTTLQTADTTYCPVSTQPNKILPHCKDNCGSPLSAETAHHPAPAYVAYMVTGDWYYMGELQFWANWLLLSQNQKYRHYAKGLVYRRQVRSQAWGLRTLGDAAYILPDRAPLAAYFDQVIAKNIQWYNNRYTNNTDANPLRIVCCAKAVVYYKKDTRMAPWQQSFFMWAVGSLAEKGFAGAEKLRDWFAPFQIGLMADPGFCWEMASAYTLKVRDTRNSPIYRTLDEVYRTSFTDLASIPCDDHEAINAAIKQRGRRNFHFPPKTMVGYPYAATGFPANFQIGLAASVVSGLPGAELAWRTFASRATKPDYGNKPQFAVIPEDADK